MVDEGLRDVFEAAGVEYYESQMLSYDWAADPLFAGNAEARARVRACQDRAFDAFAAARAYRLEFTQDVLRRAGIQERVRTCSGRR